MARKYNKTIYKIFSTGTKVIRSHCSANPMEKIEEKGAEGKMIASIGNKILEKPVQKLSYGLTNLSYNKETDNPCKGSVVYTAYYMLIKRVLKLIVGLLVMIFSTAFVMRFLNADLLMKIRTFNRIGSVYSDYFGNWTCERIFSWNFYRKKAKQKKIKEILG